MSNDQARTLKDPNECARRKAMLDLPHMKKLTAYVERLRNKSDVEVPDFDPLDGGQKAKVLFLFEKPGRKTSVKNGGSGYISRNNDDPTAEATFDFMQCAGLPRNKTIIWNVIPWWNGTRKIKRGELDAGLKEIEALLALLPKLAAVMMVGKKAAKARPYLEKHYPHLKLCESAHPSPQVQRIYPRLWNEIPGKWRKCCHIV
jgi:hypothetical protein